MSTRHIRGWTAALLACVAAPLSLAACGSNSSSTTGSSPSGSSASASSSTTAKAKVACPVNYLVVTSTTGAASAAGQGARDGSEAAIKAVNAGGGVLGCPIKMTLEDTGSDPSKSLPITIAATSQTHFANVYDSEYGGSSIAPYVMKKKLLMISSISNYDYATDPAKYPYLFDFAQGAAPPAKAAMGYAATKGIKTIVAIVDDTVYGNTIAQALKSAAQANGIKVNDVVQVPVTLANATPAILRAKSSNPDALYLDIFGTAAGAVLKGVQDAGWKVPVLGGMFSGSTDVASLVPPAAYKPFTPTVIKSVTRPATPGIQKMIDGLKSAGVDPSKIQCMSCYASGWDGVTLFAWAANKAGSLDPNKIVSVLEANGSTAVPNLATAPTTGFSSSSHVIKPQYATAQSGPLVDGLLQRIVDVKSPY